MYRIGTSAINLIIRVHKLGVLRHIWKRSRAIET